MALAKRSSIGAEVARRFPISIASTGSDKARW
jgi:hypothetical protein